MNTTKNNDYFLIENGYEAIDFNRCYDLGWGFDYYIDVLRIIERRGVIRGIRFLLSYNMPKIIPAADNKTVLFILADEKYLHNENLNKLLCIFRCIGSRPVYLDGLPTSPLKRAAIIHFLYKTYGHLRSVARISPWYINSDISNVRKKTMHIPLGLFKPIKIDPAPIEKREIDFAFLGSVDFDARQKKWFHKIFRSPKILSRQQMIDAMRNVSASITRKLWVSSAMEESIKNHSDYVTTMFNTKISIVPRGTSYESFRFFESAKAGCVIICEKLPSEWCYEDHPGFEINDWAELPGLVGNLINDFSLLNKKSKETLEYWENRCSEEALASYISLQISQKIIRGD